MTLASDLAACLDTAVLCADRARAAVTPYFRAGLTVDDKSDESPVTRADREAETTMRGLIAERHPDHAILGEEFGFSGVTGDWVWVLDPIDGTRAFITGRPSFATLIALFYKGRPVLGIIDQPFTQERWIGVDGAETRFDSATMPGQIGVRTCAGLAEAELSCTSPDMLISPYDNRFAGLKAATRRTSWGGDAYGYGLLALGQIDVIAECTMKPWDWGALVPVVTGAGGVMTDWQGAPLTLESDGTVLACGDKTLLQDAVARLRPSP
ncbi:inositol monophosphatase family protein [Asaia siamensis]|uniref:Histidinol-phosphatase n=1 Tax=Asaia siamensis TaxID=110479 RepID=A0ABQ1MBN2_9PROT|nr:inositol monophosphatase family protein [Asaia siamensis]GBR07621.1 inositol monophosphatase [Asaia siamensis NRIC 0323]GGC36550.1 histidinol-phosphatase [Asaia siamensis]